MTVHFGAGGVFGVVAGGGVPCLVVGVVVLVFGWSVSFVVFIDVLCCCFVE